MGTDWQSGTPRGTDYQRNSDSHTDWQRNANQGTDWQASPKSPAQSKARIDARRRSKYLNVGAIVDRANRKKRGKGRAKVAPNRDKIEKSVSVARPSASPAAGIASPLTEQPTTATESISFTSSDGVFELVYPKWTNYTDNNNSEVIVIHADPTPP